MYNSMGLYAYITLVFSDAQAPAQRMIVARY